VPERVLVTDGEGRASLAACRGLRAAGYEVVAGASEHPAAAHWSRAVSARVNLPDPRRAPRAFAEAAGAAAAAHGAVTIVPGNDAAVVALSASRELIPDSVVLGLPPHELVERSLDKLALADAAADVGLPGPRGIACSNLADARAGGVALGYPVAVKPARSFVQVGDGLVQRTTRIARSESELADAVEGMGHRFLLQEVIEAPVVVSLAGVLAGGELAALAVSRYARTWPVAAGNAAFSQTVEPPPGAATRLRTLLQKLGWEGVFELECFEVEGRLLPVDLNPRIYGSLALAIAAGANLPAIWVDRLRRIEAPAVVARPGVAYRWEEAELRHLLWQLRRGNVRSALAVARPLRGVAHAFVEARDPLPVAARPVDVLLRRLRRRN
jgi:predicted ATP-grasp superfamily ATP-dependent carboligase